MSAPPTELTQERKQFLLNVFITALEGGIGYWSCASEYHWSDDDGNEDLDGFHAIVHEITEDEDEDHFVKPDRWGILPGEMYSTAPIRIDAEVIEKGIKLFSWYVQGLTDGNGRQVPLNDIEPFPADHYHWQFIQANLSNGDRGDYDAGTADMIVQLAVFGEVRYG